MPDISPIAAVKLLREALESIASVVARTHNDHFIHDKATCALRLTASIEHPTSEATLPALRYEHVDGFQCGALYVEFLVGEELGWSKYKDGAVGGVPYSRREAVAFSDVCKWRLIAEAPPALPADPTDAQKLATLREGLHKWGWCAEFGALAKEVLDGPAGAPVDERAAEMPTLPQSLINLIGEYGMARTDGVSEIERLHRWQTLIAGIKDYARAALQQPGLADGWISVEDRLPEVDELVLVYSPPTKHSHPDEVDITFDCIDPNDDEHSSWQIHNERYEHYYCIAKPEGSIGPSEKAPYTHWQYFPDAPKDTP